MRIIRLIPIISSNFSPSDIGAARIGQTQGPFCTFQLFGAGTRQEQGCTAGLLQSVETFDDPEIGNYLIYTYYCYVHYNNYVHYGNYAYYNHYYNYI
jgi:hypothetical protein